METFLIILLCILAFLLWCGYKLIKWVLRLLKNGMRSIFGKKPANTTRNKAEVPCSFADGISQLEFASIVEKEAMRITKKRLDHVNISGSTVIGVVHSQSGLSDWEFTIDFNDFGHLTGEYWIRSENYDSIIPKSLAERISTSIKRTQA